MTKLADTLYAKYSKDRLNIEIIENEFGFITYKIAGDECFIVDMCVDLESRNQSFGRGLINQIYKTAQENNCKYLSADIHLTDKGASNTLFAAIKVGFKVVRADHGKLLIVKDIGG